MAAILYQQPQPVIELELLNGGSLPENTTFYFTCYYYTGFGSWSKPAEEVSVTTTSTQKSIKFKVKYWNGSQWKYDAPPLGCSYNYITIGGQNVQPLEYNIYIIYRTTSFKQNGEFVYNNGNIGYINQRVYINTPIEYTVTSYSPTAVSSILLPKVYCRYYPALRMPKIFETQDNIPFIECNGRNDNLGTVVNFLRTNYPEYVVDSDEYTNEASYIGLMVVIFFSNSNVSLTNKTLFLYNGNFYCAGKIRNFIIQLSSYGHSKAIYVNYAYDSYVSTYNHRPKFRTITDGDNNSVNSFGNQFDVNYPDNTRESYINTYLLSNAFNGQNNKNILNSLLILQKVTNTEQANNIYLYRNLSSSIVSTSWDISVMNSINTNPATFIFNGIEFNIVDRTPSEGIDYTAEKKPRIYWSGANPQGRVDVLLVFKYKVNINVVDADGNPLIANIVATNSYETINSQTGEDGKATLYIRSRDAAADNSKGIPTYYTIWTDRETTIQISKSGYKTYTYQTLFNEPTYLTVVLEKETLVVSSLSFTHPSSINNDGTITITASGGTQPYQYSIDGGQSWSSSNQFTGLGEGNYDVRVKDSDNNEVSGTIITLKAPQYYSDELSGTITDDEITGSVEVIELTGTIS